MDPFLSLFLFNIAFTKQVDVTVSVTLPDPQTTQIINDADFKTQNDLAENGDVKAMYEVANAYRWGNGTSKDIEKAIHWFEKCSNLNNFNCQEMLAGAYLYGIDIPKNLKRSEELYLQIASTKVKTTSNNYEKPYDFNEARQISINTLTYKFGYKCILKKQSDMEFYDCKK